jgi:hypothetical protein
MKGQRFSFYVKPDFYVTSLLGRAMAQVVSRWPLTAEARVRARVNPCGICGWQSGTGTVFFSEFFGFPLSVYHSFLCFATKCFKDCGKNEECLKTLKHRNVGVHQVVIHHSYFISFLCITFDIIHKYFSLL